MQVGAMNNPHSNIYKEIEWIGKAGFDFIDLTVEPEKTMPSDIDVKRVKKLMKKYNLCIVGHMGDWMLPHDLGYKSLRDASTREVISALRVLKRLGAKKVTLHSPRARIRNFALSKKRHFEMMQKVLAEAKRLKLTLMLENNSDYFEDRRNFELFHAVLKKFSALKVHIDVGHANVGIKVNETYNMMRRYGKRVQHLHFSDNFGQDDDHLELGKGSIKWERIIKFLKNQSYDGTITCETFRSGDLATIRSMKKLRKWWAMY